MNHHVCIATKMLIISSAINFANETGGDGCVTARKGRLTVTGVRVVDIHEFSSRQSCANDWLQLNGEAIGWRARFGFFWVYGPFGFLVAVKGGGRIGRKHLMALHELVEMRQQGRKESKTNKKRKLNDLEQKTCWLVRKLKWKCSGVHGRR
jgi:hypothetical protein